MKTKPIHKISLPSKLIDSIKRSLLELYGTQLNKIILFGSYARGDTHSDSDIDLMIVLNKDSISAFEEIEFINEFLYPLSLSYEKFISVVPVSANRYKQETANPLFNNIKKEGIIL